MIHLGYSTFSEVSFMLWRGVDITALSIKSASSPGKNPVKLLNINIFYGRKTNSFCFSSFAIAIQITLMQLTKNIIIMKNSL